MFLTHRNRKPYNIYVGDEKRGSSLPSLTFFWMGNMFHLKKKKGIVCRQIYLGNVQVEKNLNQFASRLLRTFNIQKYIVNL